ncbi:nesprin-3 [Mantella aurantiaca]
MRRVRRSSQKFGCCVRQLTHPGDRSLKERASQRRSPTTVIVNQTSNFITDSNPHSTPPTPEEMRNPSSERDFLQISAQYDDSHNRGAGEHHGGFSNYAPSISTSGEERNGNSGRNERSAGSHHVEHSHSAGDEQRGELNITSGFKISPNKTKVNTSTDIDGYSSSSSSKTDNSEISNRTQTRPTGNLSSADIDGYPNRSSSKTDNCETSNRTQTGRTGNLSSADIDGYPSSSSSKTDNSETSNRTQTGRTGNLSSADIDGYPSSSSSKTDNRETSNRTQTERTGNLSSADIDGYPSSSSSKTDNCETSNRTQTGRTGNLSSADIDGYPSSSSSKTDNCETSNRTQTGRTGNLSSADIDGYPSSSSSKADNCETSNRTQTGRTGNLGSNESSRWSISSKASSGLHSTEVESVHNGGSSRIARPFCGSGSSDKSTKSVKSSTEMNKASGKSRIPRPAGPSGSADESSKSLNSSIEINTTNGKASAGDEQRGELSITSGFKISLNKTKVNTRIIAGNNLKEGERNPPENQGTRRGNRKVVSLAESVDVVDSPLAPTIGGNKMSDDHTELLMEFEQWLNGENSKLNRICAKESSGSDGENTRKSRLQMLKSRVPQGQKIFESLLRCRPAMTVTEDLRFEDLRYRWMLYKSKLRDCESHASLNLTHEPRDVTKKSGGICSFLHRACCAALPLQLLLLLLLLLAFLLPLVHETQNCALANNFARSFNLMLKYDGPPPT